MMTLTEKEFKEFLKIHLDLLFFVGLKENVLLSNLNFDQFLKLDFKAKFKCRKALFENEDILDEYVASNYDHLSVDELDILNGFKRRVKSNFVILKCLTNYAIFIDTKDNKFYAVKALKDPFDMFFDRFPVQVSTVLIPFKNTIIYDGFMESYNIYFGSNIRRSLNEEYKLAKQQKIICTNLDK
jgi:hypothetical protein